MLGDAGRSANSYNPVVMRKGDGAKNPWPRLHSEEHIPALKDALGSSERSAALDPKPSP
jgi:hypothetical protein